MSDRAGRTYPSRRDNGETGYLLALGDAGRVVDVYKGTSVPTMPGTGGYTVALRDVDGSVATYPGFDALPDPAQVIDLLGKTRPMTRTTMAPGGKTNVTIDGALVK